MTRVRWSVGECQYTQQAAAHFEIVELGPAKLATADLPLLHGKVVFLQLDQIDKVLILHHGAAAPRGVEGNRPLLPHHDQRIG
jgi:hypothetical protein